MRVLIVEDEKTVGEVFRDFVAGLGHQPIVTTTAESALEKLWSERPDTILLDVRLPGMSGLEFLGLPSVRDSGIPVVAVSGVASEDQARECLGLGAFDFISKPVSLDRLSSVLSFLEPFARSRQRADGPGGFVRRPAPRVAVDFPVRIVPGNGTVWTGTCLQLSATGMRVRSQVALKAGLTARLTFTPPDRGAPIDVGAIAVRRDPEATAFWFLDLPSHESQRLRALVDQLRQ